MKLVVELKNTGDEEDVRVVCWHQHISVVGMCAGNYRFYADYIADLDVFW